MNFIELAGQERRQIQTEIFEIKHALKQLPDIRPSRPCSMDSTSHLQPGNERAASAWKMYQYLIRLDERALQILARRERLTLRLNELEKELTALDIFILQHSISGPDHKKRPDKKKKEKVASFFQRPSQPVFTNVLCDQHNLFDTKRPLHISSYTTPSHDPAVEIHLHESADQSAPEKEGTIEEIPLHPVSGRLPSGNSLR